VSQIVRTLVQEEQRASLLDDRYNAAMQNLQKAQSEQTSVDGNLVRVQSQIEADKQLVSGEAVNAFVFDTPATGMASAFNARAMQQAQARQQYTDEIVGNLTNAESTLQSAREHLQKVEGRDRSGAALDQLAAMQTQSLAKENEQAAASAGATLTQARGQLANEVAQAAGEEAQQEAAAAAAAASQQQAQQAEAASAIAAQIAGAVGGPATAADLAGSAVGGTSSGGSGGMAAAQAAESQLGVPYVFGGETPGVGFDCSGLAQWAWARAGVSIPRTTESQWESIPHVSLNALQPGDLLFYFNLDGDGQVDHVEMYIGSGPYGTDTVIHAPFAGTTVTYAPLMTAGLIGAARP
jgi:cell wall-associated NlpC family hydrolase